jgi:hypothetical protein
MRAEEPDLRSLEPELRVQMRWTTKAGESLEVRDLGDMPQIVMTAGRHRITPADSGRGWCKSSAIALDGCGKGAGLLQP